MNIGVYYQIIIPHFYRTELGKIIYTPYHKWEHIFIRLLSERLCLDAEIISGFIIKSRTCIFLKIRNNYRREQLNFNIVNCLKNGYVSHRVFLREIVAINNELACESAIYDVEIETCERNVFSSISEMYQFRQKMYDWNNVKIYSINKPMEPKIKDKASKKEDRRIIYERIMNELIGRFAAEGKASIGELERLAHINGYRFLLYGIKCDIEADLMQPLVDELDDGRGLLQRELRIKYPICYFVVPKMYIIGEETWLIFYTFMKCKYLLYFEHTILDIVLSITELKGQLITKVIIK